MCIYDCMYGEIKFKRKIIRCMLTPEMQRLREVRLGNINSLFLTGCTNINRYEHSIGTAYLAMINADANKHFFSREKKESFILAALFHDLANGPFGHSYEYIAGKQGFIPEKSLIDVILPKKNGPYRKLATCEPFYLGEPNEIGRLLSKREIIRVDEIVRGDDSSCSKLLSDVIDIDNIDNVYRMAFHMGIPIDKNVPSKLAEGMVCKDNQVYFKDSVIPYLYDWYDIRSKMYQMLLYNPQDVAAKYMLTEALDNVLKNRPSLIKWHFTDSELISALVKMDEIWENRFVPLFVERKSELMNFKKKDINEKWIRNVFDDVSISIPDNAKIKITIKDTKINVSFYNTEYCIMDGRIFKKERISYNNSRIIKRLMRGDLYYCLAVVTSDQIDKADLFLEYNSRQSIETECNLFLKQNGISDGDVYYNIGFHPIVDKNKTHRQMEICMLTGERFLIGENSQKLLIGIVLKNAIYGLANKGGLSEKKRRILQEGVCKFLRHNGVL